VNSIRDNNPVAFFEHRQLYNMNGYVPKNLYTVPFGVANLLREGSDVTVIALGKMVKESLEAADMLKEKISVEVIDPRTIVPLDEESILKSVAKTGRLVVVDEDYERCGFSSEVLAIVAEKGFHSIRAPLSRVANPNVPIPYNRNLEKEVLPDKAKIIRTIKNTVKRS
jgi:pyruvate dehydrogenase E1 component beta subunit